MPKIQEKVIQALKEDPIALAEKLTVSQLATLLRKLANLYYNDEDSLVSDVVFDDMKDVLKKRDPANSFLTEIGAPVTKEKKKLPFPMGSLNKVTIATNELEKFVKKYKGPYEQSDKLDGSSAQLYKTPKGEFQLFTRGDGINGTDITHLIPYVIPKTVKLDKIKNGESFRGEIIMTKKAYEKVSHKMKTPRAAVNGLVNSKTVDREIAKLTKFVAYQVLWPRMKQDEQMPYLKDYGFEIVDYTVEKELTKEKLKERLTKRKKDSSFEVDGIVVVDCSKVYDNEEGYPDHAFAFKDTQADQFYETTVLDVIWTPSMDGYLKPKVRIEPVNIKGTTVEFATAHNAKFINDNLIGPGSKIKIIMGGEIIPKIQEVLKPSTSGKAKMPTVAFVWNKSKVDIILKDIHGAQGDEVMASRMEHFFKTLKIKFISEGVIKKLIENGYNTIPKILSADHDKLAEIEGIGEKMVTKIFDSINENLKNAELHIFMAASHEFGRNLGREKLKEVINMYPNILNEKWTEKQMVEKLLEVDGFSDLSAEKFAANFSKFMKFFDEINKIINISHLKKVADTGKSDGRFDGMTIVFTGFVGDDYKKIVTANGGKMTDSVSKNTSLVVVVYTDKESSKLKKAKDLKIPIMTKEEFAKKYKLPESTN
jgi:NAD-dependent DNA ligase